MKKYIVFGGLLVSSMYALAVSSSQAEKEMKKDFCKKSVIATISSQKIVGDYNRVKEFNKNLEANVNSAQQELVTMMEAYEKAVKEYQELLEKSENPVLKEEAKSQLKKEAEEKLEVLRQKEQAMMDFRGNSEKRINQQRLDESMAINNNIRNVIAVLSKEKGVNVVLDSDNPGVFYADTDLDITTEVLTKLNADFKSTEKGKAAETVRK